MKNLHFISHTHWDREWYLPYQKLRYRMVKLIDNLLDLLDNNPEFKYYYLDGQTILIEDYIEIKPQNKEKLKKYIEEGRIKIGPWYVLQDEYLTSGESNIRSLMLGIITGEKYGGVAKLGYFPDAFGNISQAPQILNGFNISNSVFGRGINPVGFNNQIGDKDYNEYPSEIYWESPDGSRVLGIFMANWYNNANEIPENLEKAVNFINQAKQDAEKYATTNHLLMMNGCDHQPTQGNLPEILDKVQDEVNYKLIHSNLEKYINEVEKEAEALPVVNGELNNQHTDGWLTLRNTASSRMYLKQLNYQTQNMLERYVEPLETMAWLAGKDYEKEFIWQSWKYLLQNHPHDSICGCSVDDVHDEMVIRFKNSLQISESLIENSVAYILESMINSCYTNDLTVTIFNTLNWRRTDIVEVVLHLPEDILLDNVVLVDCNNKQIPVDIKDFGVVFNYQLPDDGFRVVKYPKKYKLRFLARDIPGNGYKSYSIVEANEDNTNTENNNSTNNNTNNIQEDFVLENRYLRVDINDDGSFNILDKDTNNSYYNLNVYQDSGDVGDEYIYKAPDQDEIVSTSGKKAEIKKIKDSEVETVYSIKQNLKLPQESIKKDNKKTFRSDQYINCVIETVISLMKKSRRLDVITSFNNKVKDHRLRVLFPTGIDTSYHYADGQFDVLERSNSPWEGWENPSNCQRQQKFVNINDGERGLMIANKGLPEYEIIPEKGNSIGLTLLRSVGEMGDWGYFPTPKAQCIGLNSYEYSIIPHSGDYLTSKAFREANNFNSPLLGYQSNNTCQNEALFDINSDYIILSALKKAEDRDSIIVRFYNISDESEDFKLKSEREIKESYIVNMNEERKEKINLTNSSFQDTFLKKQIKTYELVY